MKRISILPIIAMFSVLLSLSSCELIADIFYAGIWVGVILVIAIVAIIIWLIRKIF